VAALQPSLVHPLLSSQARLLVPLLQLPPLQTSPKVQALPSSQLTLLFVWTHPVAVAQLSSVQPLSSLQSVADPGEQLPSAHRSPLVQALPSSQAAVLKENWQPTVASQLSFVQALLSLQVKEELPAEQLPSAHVSPRVQVFPSSQEAVLFAWTQPLDGSQLSSVHALLSLQLVVPVPTQTPLSQTSVVVQLLPSLQFVVLFAYLQPSVELQESSVQLLLSSQLKVVDPETQILLTHVSPIVQAFPSSQEIALAA